MTTVTHAMVWTADNVSSFRGFDINSAGEVELSDSEYSEYLDEAFGDVSIAGCTYGSGSALQGVDPVAFRCGKGDYESELTTELEEALQNEDDSDIKFSEYEPDDITEEDEQ